MSGTNPWHDLNRPAQDVVDEQIRKSIPGPPPPPPAPIYVPPGAPITRYPGGR